MSDSPARAGLSVRFIILAVVAVGAAVVIGWTIGKLRTGWTDDKTLIQAAGFTDLRGTDPPPLTVSDAVGTTVKLSDLRGKLVLLHFWGKGCAHCVKEMPVLNELEKIYLGRIVVLHVCASDDDPVGAQKVLDRAAPGTTSHSELTGLGLARFETNSLPTVWLINATGKAIGRASGAKDWESQPLKELILHFLPQETK